MTEPINPELFDHLVELAALELSEKESEYLRAELNKQIKSIRELETIPLEQETKITSHGVPYTSEISPPIREDIWQPNQDVEKILEQAPEVEHRYIIVPDIPHTDLE
jgi:aspartyl/glutamyl-tRNA(Asn/Gln) amidotransferase C subunit